MGGHPIYMEIAALRRATLRYAGMTGVVMLREPFGELKVTPFIKSATLHYAGQAQGGPTMTLGLGWRNSRRLPRLGPHP